MHWRYFEQQFTQTFNLLNAEFIGIYWGGSSTDRNWLLAEFWSSAWKTGSVHYLVNVLWLHSSKLFGPAQFVAVIWWLWLRLTINWDKLFQNKNCQNPKDEDNLEFRNNKSQLTVNCANNHPITATNCAGPKLLFIPRLYEIIEQKRDVYKKYYEPYN